MEFVALGMAAVAVLFVFKMKGELALLRDSLASANAGSSGPSASRELERALETNRTFLARLAAGETLDPEQILEGRTWGDVNQARAIELLEQGVRIIDVRTPQETLAGILPGAIRMPVDDLPMRFGELGRRSTPTLVYCAMGVRSAAACEFLSEQGFMSLHNLEAGYTSWSGPTVLPDG